MVQVEDGSGPSSRDGSSLDSIWWMLLVQETVLVLDGFSGCLAPVLARFREVLAPGGFWMTLVLAGFGVLQV